MSQERRSKTLKSPKPQEASKRAERYYNARLQDLTKEMERAVNESIIPLLRDLQPEYTADAWYDQIFAEIERLKEQFDKTRIGLAMRNTAEEFIKIADTQNRKQFLQNMAASLGVDLTQAMEVSGIADDIRMRVQENVRLIQELPSEFFNRIQTTIVENASNGVRASEIAKELRKDYGIAERKAKLIARDQTLKFHSEVSKARQTASGVEYFRWIDSNDSRVSGRPNGLYPNAKVKCWQIANNGNGGVYSWKNGAKWSGETKLFPGKAHINCRCIAEPVIKGVNDQGVDWSKVE